MVESGSAGSGAEICLDIHSKACHILSKTAHYIINYLCALVGNQWLSFQGPLLCHSQQGAGSHLFRATSSELRGTLVY